jgi:REP element-mobilizing transposase RayT
VIAEEHDQHSLRAAGGGKAMRAAIDAGQGKIRRYPAEITNGSGQGNHIHTVQKSKERKVNPRIRFRKRAKTGNFADLPLFFPNTDI